VLLCGNVDIPAGSLIPHFLRAEKNRPAIGTIPERIARAPAVAYPCEFAKPTFAAARANKSPARNGRSGITMVIREQRFSIHQVRQVLGSVLDHDLHAKRIDSLCGATLGVLRSGSLAICTIGQGLAAARGVNPKHATKQVDRLLSNPKINVDDILARWVPYIVGARSSIVVALTGPTSMPTSKPLSCCP